MVGWALFRQIVTTKQLRTSSVQLVIALHCCLNGKRLYASKNPKNIMKILAMPSEVQSINSAQNQIWISQWH